MGEKRRCEGCGKDYWWPACRWQHEKCGDLVKGKFDKVAYQRAYMRVRREKLRNEAKKSEVVGVKPAE